MEYNRLSMVYAILAIKLAEVNINISGNSDNGAILLSQASIPEPCDRLPRNTLLQCILGSICDRFHRRGRCDLC